MSDTETQPEAEAGYQNGIDIGEFIDAIAAQNFNQAKAHFDDLLQDRMDDALEQEKIVVANNIYNGVDDSDIEDDEPELDVEDEVEEEPEEVQDEEESS